MKKIELLAPAGSMESLHAAIQNGADAVYLGGAKFSARAYASNFDEENMIKAVDYCHLYNVKIYVTINTLLKDNEIQEALEYAVFLYQIGVDALIIQDPGLAYLLKKNLPDFEIHASTQMTVHNGEGALFLNEIGFQRIVLSRELSLEEIKNISLNLGIETEIFVHGALCICYSGQCLMSSMIGGRSGNRGRCAQPCRLPYTLLEQNSGKQNSAYILSPKDICTIEDTEKIIESGTSSLKIEGRMKRPEYVAGVVSNYRKAIDKANKLIDFDPKEGRNNLLKLFNREGFSKAYMFGNKGRDMMSYNFPKNTGIFIGKVLKDSRILLEDDITIKDGIRVGEEGFVLTKILKGDKEVTEAFKGDIVKLIPGKYRPGNLLFKTSDIKLLSSLEDTFSNPFSRKIDLALSVKFKAGEALEVETEYRGNVYNYQGEVIQNAIKKPVDKEKLIDNLSKSGDTPFRFGKISFKCFESGFLPLSSINEARRAVIQKIEDFILKDSKRKFDKNIKYENRDLKESKLPETMVMIRSLEQLNAVNKLDIKDIIINPFMRDNNIKLEDLIGKNIYLKIPNIIRNEYENICKFIEGNLNRISGIITSNLGIISRFHNDTSIIGDYKLNIFNKYGLSFYRDFIHGASISMELNKKEIENLAEKAILPTQILAYGRIELMVSEYCPVGSIVGGKCEGNPNCSGACNKGKYVLKDRKGEEFKLRMDRYCRSYIFNNAPINLIQNLDELKKSKVKSFRLEFSDEGYEETLEILNSYQRGKWDKDFLGYTRGHYKRGVE